MQKNNIEIVKLRYTVSETLHKNKHVLIMVIMGRFSASWAENKKPNDKKWLIYIHFTTVHILLAGKLNDDPTIRIILLVMKKIFVKAERHWNHGARLTICCRPTAIPNVGWERVEKRESRQRESVVWEGAIIAVVMGPCTYFMAPGVSSHSY